jgi:predicted site-specific integrase-resolvase
MKLSQWAKKQGITYRTAYTWFAAGKIPGAIQYPTGTIIIQDIPTINQNDSSCVIYCRVSTHFRKNELQYQVDRCEEFCRARGYSVTKVYKEIASGMNDKRKELTKMLDSNPSIIVVENKDRLTRFGFNYLNNLLCKLNCKIVVINEAHEDEQDFIKDMISIVTYFCCRLYGLRRSKNKISKIKKVLFEEE